MTPEFQRQAPIRAAVKAAGKPVKFLIGESYNHFEMLETLATPYGLLGPRAARADEAAITSFHQATTCEIKIPANSSGCDRDFGVQGLSVP